MLVEQYIDQDGGKGESQDIRLDHVETCRPLIAKTVAFTMSEGCLLEDFKKSDLS